MSYIKYLCTVEHNEMFITAVQAVLQDNGFKFPSPSAAEAVRIAQQLLPWCKNVANRDTLTAFAMQLFEVFDRCVAVHKDSKLSHSKRMEKIWGTFHMERCSQTYKACWSSFLSTSVQHHHTDSPIFYQFITDQLFKNTLKEIFKVEVSHAQRPDITLDYDEKNCIQYVAGALFRAVQKKIKRSALPMKEELLLCMVELLEADGVVCDDESSDWIGLVDRGGLKHVSNTTFWMICAMEMEIKDHIQKTKNINRDVLKQKLLENDEVDFYWETISTNWEEKESKALFSVISDHYLTVRGFAFASNWMEQYKDKTKKKVQKSKGLRKTLLGPAADTKVSEDHE